MILIRLTRILSTWRFPIAFICLNIGLELAVSLEASFMHLFFRSALFFCCFTPPVIPTTAGTSASGASHLADPLVQRGTLQAEELKKNYFHYIFWVKKGFNFLGIRCWLFCATWHLLRLDGESGIRKRRKTKIGWVLSVSVLKTRQGTRLYLGKMGQSLMGFAYLEQIFSLVLQ